MFSLIQLSILRTTVLWGILALPTVTASSLAARTPDAAASITVSATAEAGAASTSLGSASPPALHRVLMIANGASSIFASLNQMRYLEYHSKKRMGEIFDAAAGGSLAGSFLASAIFLRGDDGQFLTVSAIHSFVHEFFDEMTTLNTSCCFWQPRNMFNADRLTHVLNRFFGDKKLSDLGGKKLIIPLRLKGTTTDYMASSDDYVSRHGEDFYLKDLVRASSSTKGYFKSTRTVSLGGRSYRFGDLWPTVRDSTLPVMLKLTREFNDGDYSHYHVLSIGQICTAVSPTEDDSILRDKVMDEALSALLGDNFVRPCITVTERQSAPFMVSPAIVRRLIHASNPEDRTNLSQKTLLDRFLTQIGERRVIPKRIASTALIVDGGRVTQVRELPSSPSSGSTEAAGFSTAMVTSSATLPLPVIPEATEAESDEDGTSSPISGRTVVTPRSVAASLASDDAPAEI